MKRVIKLIVSVLVISILAIVANLNIVHSDGTGRSVGCLEYLFFRRAIFRPTSPYNKWQMSSAKNGSDEIEYLIDEYGTNLYLNSEYEELRLFAIDIANRAIEESETVEIIYLKEIHKKFPEAYRDKYIMSLKLWRDGIVEQEHKKVSEGSLCYSQYRQWLLSNNLDKYK